MRNRCAYGRNLSLEYIFLHHNMLTSNIYEPDDFRLVFLHTSSLCGSYYHVDANRIGTLMISGCFPLFFLLDLIDSVISCNIAEGITGHLFCLLSWLQATPAEEEVGTGKIGESDPDNTAWC